MIYNCEVSQVPGTMLTNMGATKNYVSARYAKKANLHFNKGVNADSQVGSIRLPNGQDLKILGRCEFELKMSEWTGMAVGRECNRSGRPTFPRRRFCRVGRSRTWRFRFHLDPRPGMVWSLLNVGRIGLTFTIPRCKVGRGRILYQVS